MRGRLRGVKTRRNEDPEHRSKGPQTQDRPWNRVNPSTTVLHSFAGGADGANPYASLTLDAADNLYGTSSNGGTHNKGTVYKLDPTGHESVLHSFADSGTFTAAPGRDSGRTGGPPPLSAAVRTLRDYGGGLALAIKNEMLQRLE